MPHADSEWTADRPLAVGRALPRSRSTASARWRAEKLAAGIAGVACVIYWAVTLVLARRKLMWNDELYTYYVAMLPSMHDVWSALMARGEQTPPLFYLLTRLALRLGVNNISIRLPEMLAFFGMSACLFVSVRRRTTRLAGLCAALFPLVTSAYAYAFEARAYALVLGFAAGAYLSWQSLAFGTRRALWLTCLTLSLAAAASSHYYGAFVLVPLAAGEIVRSMVKRRIDPAVWVAFALSIVPLAWQLPLIRAGRAYSGAFWSPPQWVNIPDTYADLLTPALIPLVAILVACGVAAWRQTRDNDELLSAPIPLPLDDIAAALGFVAIPIVAVIAAKLVTGAFVTRYALPAVIGFSILAGFGSASAFKRNAPAMRLLVVIGLCGWFFLSEAREMIQPTGVTLPVSVALIARPTEWLNAVPQEKRGLPLVIADPHSFVTLSHYGEAETKAHLVYLADPDRALARLGANSVERGMLDLVKPWFRMNVVRFEPFVATHDEFFVYGDFVRLAFLNWIVPELHAQGMRTELLNRAGDDMLLYVYRDGSHGISAGGQ